MNLQTIILAAGKGTRMGDENTPKVLFKLSGKPMIRFVVNEVEKLNLSLKPIFVVGHKYDLVQKELGSSYVYAFQEGQLGTAHAVDAAKGFSLGTDVLVLYGDMPFVKTDSLKKLMKLHEQSRPVVSMFTTTVDSFEGQWQSLQGFGRIIRNDKNEISSIREFKDASENERMIKEVNPGIYIFKADWLWQNIDKIQNNNAQKEYYLTDLIQLASEQGLVIKSVQIDPREVFGINTKEQLVLARQLV
ncbi:MAG: NTP transferase domain-containing protein [Candidatus Doudnabacteria bacterium]|nr:NTP transferase domain-containing protein [Candidatus Doudnabacteria bacterium]